MKKVDGEIVIEDVEIPTLKSEPKKVGYKFKVNAYPVNQLNEWRKMIFVVDGELASPSLLGYHIGNGEYWVGDSTPRKKKPKNIELYKY